LVAAKPTWISLLQLLQLSSIMLGLENLMSRGSGTPELVMWRMKLKIKTKMKMKNRPVFFRVGGAPNPKGYGVDYHRSSGCD
jgi:hypothetical protein